MLEICIKEGAVKKNDIPMSLEHTCIKKDALISAINTMYEVYKVDKLWESRVKESRIMVARQLAGMSKILQTMEKHILKILCH